MKKLFGVIILIMLFLGCTGATGAEAMASEDPIAKGLGQVAAAILTHGILQIIFRSGRSK